MTNTVTRAPREPRAEAGSSTVPVSASTPQPDPAQENRRSLVKAAAFFLGSLGFILLLKIVLGY